MCKTLSYKKLLIKCWQYDTWQNSTYFTLYDVIFRSLPQWGGSCSKDGRYGIYAPSRGGLDILDLRHGTVMRTLIPKIAEGIFNVICKFNETNEYVLYYHSGRKTLRVFRVSDGVMIANYRYKLLMVANYRY